MRKVVSMEDEVATMNEIVNKIMKKENEVEVEVLPFGLNGIVTNAIYQGFKVSFKFIKSGWMMCGIYMCKEDFYVVVIRK